MTELVGILNVTPDSFSDGGEYLNTKRAVAHAEKLFADGAAFIDIGAESTRPNAAPISLEEEQHRLAPVLSMAATRNWHVSIDTHHPETVRWASTILGSFIINDVTGFSDPKMQEVAAEIGGKIIVSHLPANAGTDIQAAHKQIPIDSCEQVLDELSNRIVELRRSGVQADNIIVDPGIGFGKTPRLNRELLFFAERVPGRQVMIGYSRKRFLGEKRMELETNLAAGRIAVGAKTAYLRVHDVAGHQKLFSTYF